MLVAPPPPPPIAEKFPNVVGEPLNPGLLFTADIAPPAPTRTTCADPGLTSKLGLLSTWPPPPPPPLLNLPAAPPPPTNATAVFFTPSGTVHEQSAAVFINCRVYELDATS